MRLSFCALLLLLFACCTSHGADEVSAADGSHSSGTVLHWTTQTILIQCSGATLKKVEAAKANVRLDLEGHPRCALITDSAGKTLAVKITSAKPNLLEAVADDGTLWSSARNAFASIELYPTDRLSRLLPIEYSKQKPDYCGEASVEMVARYLGQALSQDLVNQAGGLSGQRGVYSGELEAAVVKLKLKSAPAAAAFKYADASDALLDRSRLIQALERKRPVLLGIWADPEHKSNPAWNFDHFVLLVGYDLSKQVFLIHDPGCKALWEVPFASFVAHRQTRANFCWQIEFPFVRKWSLKTAKVVEGELLEQTAARVRLKTPAGQQLEIPLNDFIQSERDLLDKLR